MKNFNDLEFNDHSVIKGATASYMQFPNGQWISIVGGGSGLCGDGETSFEMMSSSTESKKFGVKGWRSKTQISLHMRYLQSKK